MDNVEKEISLIEAELDKTLEKKKRLILRQLVCV